MKTTKKVLISFLCMALLLITVFLIGRYGWKLGGFCTCETAGIEQINVEENHVRIRGFYPGSFPTGFLGYHAEQLDHTLYVGFKFSALFGLFETGDFDITIPTKGTVTQIVVKSGGHEYTVWPQEDEFFTSEAKAAENGIEPDESAVPTVYAPILKPYRTALEENWTGQQLVDAELNYMIKDVPPEAVGYAVDDLDDDDVPELIIGTISTDGFYGKMIFVLYTMDDDGKPVQIFSSIERNRYYYAGGTQFANIGSSGADSSYVTTLKLEGEGLVDMTFITDPKDYVQMQFVPIAESSKTTPENAAEIIYEGEYASYDTDEPMLYIQKNEDGTYSIQVGIYRLIQLDHCVGVDKGNRLEFSTMELGENQEITGTIILNGEVATVTLYAPWSDTWFIDVNEFDYYKLNIGK